MFKQMRLLTQVVFIIFMEEKKNSAKNNKILCAEAIAFNNRLSSLSNRKQRSSVIDTHIHIARKNQFH